MIESTIILISLIRSFMCFSLASSYSGSATYPLMYLSRSFSLRMRPILYFHAQKFSIPSSLSSSLVLGAILSKRSLKIEISQNEKMTLPGDALDQGELVGPLGFCRSQIFTLQNLLARFQFLHNFWYWFSVVFLVQAQTRFEFPGYSTT